MEYSADATAFAIPENAHWLNKLLNQVPVLTALMNSGIIGRRAKAVAKKLTAEPESAGCTKQCSYKTCHFSTMAKTMCQRCAMATDPIIGGLELLNDAPFGAYAVNFAQIIRFWNPGAELITGHIAENVTGRPCYEILQNLTADGDAPVCRHGCPSLRALQEGRMPQAYEVSMLCAYGARKTVAITPIIILGTLTSETVLVHLFHESRNRSRAQQIAKTVGQTLHAPHKDQEPMPEIMEQLTQRELEVLRHTGLGMTHREISQKLHVSYHTVRNHTAAIRRKLGARNKPNMVKIAQSLDLI